MKVYLDTIGCRLNQAEIERMAAQLRLAGHTLVENPGEAEMVIVNTCAVTTQAASDSRQKIRQAVRAGAGQVVVTGCWATMDGQAASSLPGVTRVVGNPEKDRLICDLFNLNEEESDLKLPARQPLPGTHLRTRAFIKVQDGCDNHCTYCITRIVRGPGRSRSVQEIFVDIQAALEGGTKEIVLTGVHLGSWGQDFSSPLHLRHLIERILRDTDTPRLRLSSLEPWDLEEDFFSLWANPRLCRHLHLPLQSGSETVLRRMARKTTPALFENLVQKAREVCPPIAITTDIIAGFPGETDEEFAETMDMIRRIHFAAGHVFTYSARPGTAAARMANQVPHPVRKSRSATLRSALAEATEAYHKLFLGEKLDTLWETAQEQPQGGWLLSGLTDNYLKVTAASSNRLWNCFSRVQIEGVTHEGVSGVIVDNDSPNQKPLAK